MNSLPVSYQHNLTKVSAWLTLVWLLMPLFGWSTTVLGPGIHPAHYTDSTAVTDSILTVGNIILSGNFKTKEHIILREMFLKSGSEVPAADFEERVERDRQRIFNTQLFTQVKINTIERDSARVDLFIQMQERWYFIPSLIFKLADRNFNDWWTNQNRDLSRVDYGLRLKHYNFLGRAQRIAMQAQFGYTRSVRLNYYNPYIDRQQKTGLSLNYAYAENKNIPYRTARNRRLFLDSSSVIRRTQFGSIGVFRRPSLNTTHYISVAYLQSTIATTVLQENPDYLSPNQDDLSYLSYTYGFVHDQRDNVGYPLRGYTIEASIGYLDQTPANAPSLLDASSTLQYYQPLGRKFYSGFLLNLRGSSLKQPPYTLLTGLGYNRSTVRGLELYVIEGQHHAISRNELKYQAFNHVFNLGKLMPFEQFRKVPLSLYPKVYFDAGYVYKAETFNGNDLLLNKPVWGTGFGLDIVSYYDFVLKLEYSFNNLGERGFFFNLNTGF